jgi:hypothetical protein
MNLTLPAYRLDLMQQATGRAVGRAREARADEDAELLLEIWLVLDHLRLLALKAPIAIH